MLLNSPVLSNVVLQYAKKEYKPRTMIYSIIRMASIVIKPQMKEVYIYHLLEILKYLAVRGETDITALIIQQQPDL